LFKNALFLKIILIFTLPALGILYFSTILVYDKISSFDEVGGIHNNISYLNSTEKLLSSLQQEREVTINQFLIGKNKNTLQEQRLLTNQSFSAFKIFISSFGINLNQIKFKIEELEDLRTQIDNSEVLLDDVLNKYNNNIKLLLDSLSLIKPIKLAFDFNSSFKNIIHFLNFKDAVYIERILINIFIVNHKIDDNLYSIFLKSFSIQEINKDYFFSNLNLNLIQNYNSKLQEEYYSNIFLIRTNIKNKDFSLIDLTFEKWKMLSEHNNDFLKDTYDNLILAINKSAISFEDEANSEKQKSLLFLFVCFSTLISLLFVLRNIIFTEQKSFYKVQKHKEVYKLLNKANKFFLKVDNKKRLYSNISELLLENNNMVFCFIYDFYDNEIIAKEGPLKDKVLTQKDNYSNLTKDNIVSKTIKWETNIIINSFEKKNISTFYDDAKELNINSMASFPIKKFDKTVGTFVLYSKEDNFFDDEIEILFDKLINDITHCLEKIDYEEIRINQEDELRLSSYAFESSEPMIITNEIGEIVKVNQAFCNVMGYAREDIIGKNPRIFKSSHQDKKFADELWNDLKIKGFWSGEVYNKKANNQILPLRSTITAIKNNDGRITHFLGQYIDIGEQKDKEKILEYQATHDNLTGLPNRLLLLDRIEHAITKVVRHKMVGGLIFIDLDNFKEVNDTLGHDIGDALLVMVSKTIREVIRDEDTLARIGGDEFIILVDNIGNNKNIAKVNITSLAEKIKDSLNAITHIEGHMNVSTPSIGITLFNDASVSVKDIIKQADTAMYVAKKQGKNAIEFF
jgi:diguanylate cyclase (GGDEF)-like protein/PAS domain S-box-containing protein